MMSLRRRIPEIACSVLSFCIYLATIAPSLTWAHYGADGGDLITAIAKNSLPHPPGSPTYLLLGGIFFGIPFGDPAWRLNLMSASMSAIAAGIVTASARRVIDSGRTTTLVAICTGLCTSFAPLVWSQSLIAEVYTLAVLVVALLIYLAVSRAPMWLMGLMWGVGMGAHPVVAFTAPLLIWRVCQERDSRARQFIEMSACALVGWDIVFGPVLFARGGVASPWGEVNTIDGWWAYVSAQIYHGYLTSLTLDAMPQRILELVGNLLEQFTPVGAIIALVGGARLWRTQRALAIVSLVIVIAISLFSIFYNTVDSMVYLIFAVPIATLWLASGLAHLATWLNRRWRLSASLILLIPLLQMGLFWNRMDLHDDHAAMSWADQVLYNAPPRAILRTAEDAHTFTLWYAHDVLGMRPDIVVVDRDLWGLDSYQKMLQNILGENSSLDEIARESGRPLVDVPQGAQGITP
jgi:hypothetical protein